MITDILILIVVSGVIYFVLPFISDVLSFPFNFLSILRIKKEHDFGVRYETKWYDLVLAFLAFSIFSYLIFGIGVSYFCWISERNPTSYFAKTSALVLVAVLASSFSRRAGLIYLQEPTNSILPSVMGAMYVKLAVYLLCIMLLIFPEIKSFWWWMPYVN